MRTFALRHQWRKNLVTGLALVLFFAACFPTARADDAPAHRAARLSYLTGDVTVDHLDNTAGDPAQVNMPLAEGSRLTTGEDGEAEVEFEDGSLVRLTPNSSLGLNVLSVDPAENFHTQMMVLHGLVYAKLHASSKYFYVVDAGGELVTPVANATVRINLDQPPATISVFDGTVQVEHPRSPQAEGYKKDVRAGEMVTGDASYSGQYSLSQNIDQDSWDEWNRSRDQAAADAALSRTAARDNYAGDERYGWSDLDANGSWYDVPGQGQVWQPTLAQEADFDPYGYGSWVAYPGTGYVWASGYSWGWTPFRCGRWSYWNGFGWGWSPVGGCGRRGWGFGGGVGHGVYVVNIGHPPSNYRLPTRPVHEPGMLRPIPVGHVPREPGTEIHHSHEPRFIAGVPVEPMRPIGNASSAGSHSIAGAAPRSGYAVDPNSRRPAPGAVGAPPAAASRGDFRAVPPRPVSPPAATSGVGQPARPTGPAPPQQRPAYSGQPPGPPQGEHSASRPSVPSVYAPRSAPPPSPPPAPRTAPIPPSAPSAPRGNQSRPN